MKGKSASPLSGTVCPDGMTLQQWQKALRRQTAEKSQFSVSDHRDTSNPGLFSVTGQQSRRSYRVLYRGEGSQWNSCECMDFRTNRLGTCKHIEAVALWLEKQHRQPSGQLPLSSGLDVSYTNGRRIRLRIGQYQADEIALAALRYFDDENCAAPGMVAELPAFIEQARKIDSHFHCTSDALNLILEERDRLRRAELADSFSDEELATVLRTRLYPYQIEGIRFAFKAGRALIADEMGLGKTVQALGMAELLLKKNMAGSVLVVCPTSLKYQWKKEIERFCGRGVTVIEGVSSHRRALYDSPEPYKIVSYHTLANDIKALSSLHVDMLIMDEVQRLKNWNTQISKAARRVESDYAAVLSGTPLENKLDELYSVMQFVDQFALGPLHEFIDSKSIIGPSGKVTGYKNLNIVAKQLKNCMIRRRKSDVEFQLPERTDKVLFVPMTKEQRAIHDEEQTIVARLVYKWRQMNFLSEKDRKRLLLLLSRMRMVCDSTFVLDQKSRYDTKVGETLQLILTLIENGDGKAVVFSQWERMTRLVAEELTRAGIEFVWLHGSVPSARRGTLVDEFMTNPDVRVFLSTDAGATGLNLQNASTIINMDLPWNPAILEQRVGRIYRIGQQHKVQVINLVSAGTIEERMLATLNFKQNLFSGIFDGGEDQITLDDNKLTRIVEALTTLLDTPEDGGVPTDEGSLIVGADTEADVCAEPEVTPSVKEAPATDELIKTGLSFMDGLAATLSSEQATARLLDAIVETDPDSGQSSIRIPVESKESVARVVEAFASLFRKSRQ